MKTILALIPKPGHEQTPCELKINIDGTIALSSEATADQ